MLRTRSARILSSLLLLTAAAAGFWSWRQSGATTPGPEPASAARTSDEAGGRPITPMAIYPRPGPGLNLLALEASPYLQLHAQNPVDWYPWSPAAFERARTDGKPIFLSIGYSTCYWCHVMEREVFSNPEIAALMNTHFVSIKVDREERPDVDDVYMQATQLLTGSGGWPNSLFLTPGGKPFYAGTYFPPEDRPGRPGFPRVLEELHESWSKEREKLEGVADRVIERISAMSDLGTRTSGEAPPIQDSVRKALQDLAESYEPEHGGFSRAVKFPRPPALQLIATSLEKQADPARLAMLTHTLEEMALGGIYDQLAGGFHRYTTEPTWSIPHFEKMLYDNAQLVRVYAQAYALTGRPLYRRITEETVRYLDREMSLPEGGFASAQDAEVHGEEGRSYIWRRDQIVAVLGVERAESFLGVYELAPTRENPAVGVLRVRLQPESEIDRDGGRHAVRFLGRFDADRAALLEARNRRPQPMRDDKALVAWNALAIRGLVAAAEALGQRAYLERAERAARFLLARLRAKDGSLRRSYIAGQAREQGVLDDYAFFVDALLALRRATGDPIWLAEARELANTMLARLSDPNGGGLFLTPEGHRLPVRPKSFDEGDRPSGNAVAFGALRELARETGDARYSDAASGIAAAAAPLLRRSPSALATMVAALSEEPIDASKPGKTRAMAKREEAGLPAPARAAIRLPQSEDHVRATLTPAAGDRDPLVVRVEIDPGWHIQANPASHAFLIATEVELMPAPAGAEVRYPEGRELRTAFARESIRVYDGVLEIPVRLPQGAAPPAHVALRFQACDEKLCLPPSRIELVPRVEAEAVDPIH